MLNEAFIDMYNRTSDFDQHTFSFFVTVQSPVYAGATLNDPSLQASLKGESRELGTQIQIF